MKEEIGKRIRKAREAAGIKSGELAVKCGWSDSRSRVSNYENGISAPSYSDMERIANVLGVDAAYLAFGKGVAKPSGHDISTTESNAELIGGIEVWDSKTPLDSDEVEVPFYMEVEAAAGAGMIPQAQYEGPKLRFAKSTLKRQGIGAGNAVCLKVAGDSMAPVIPDQAVIGIDTGATSVKDGEIYAIQQGDLLRVKVLYRIPGGYRLKSFNEEYEQERVDGADAEKLQVIGRVFWYSVLR